MIHGLIMDVLDMITHPSKILLYIMHCQLVIVVDCHRPRVHGTCIHHGLLPSVNDLMSRIQDLLSRIHDWIPRSHEGRGGALWLLVQCLQHLVHHLLLAGMLLSPQAKDLELILHLLTTGLRAHGLATLESGFQCLDDRGHAIDGLHRTR